MPRAKALHPKSQGGPVLGASGIRAPEAVRLYRRQPDKRMLASLRDHVMVKREISKGDAGWRGHLACSCGWSILLGPFVASLVVVHEMAESWTEHVEKGA
jgi:hypothetical protein